MTELKFTPAQGNWLEVTWTEVDGEKRTELKHVSYHPTQLDLLQADVAAMGMEIAPQHEDMLAAWVDSYVPEPVKPEEPPKEPTLKELQDKMLVLMAQIEAKMKG